MSLMARNNRKSPAGIEYVGIPGVTEECKNAVMRLLQYSDQITRVRILSCARDHGCKDHCLLLTVNVGDIVAVKSGFASGYLGEGSHGFSFILQLLETHGAEIQEYNVDAELIERLDMSLLTRGDIEKIDAVQPVRPTRWYDYIVDRDEKRGERGTLWWDFPPVIPWSIIDNRIADLALNFFKRPDNSLLTGYRRLEDIVRNRTDIDEHGVKLFSQAFVGKTAKLGWKNLDENEQVGRGQMFIATYMAYRNPRAHRELEHEINSLLAEFILLNNLFLLEKESCERIVETEK